MENKTLIEKRASWEKEGGLDSYLATIPTNCVGPAKDSHLKDSRTSYTRAIKAKCQECCGFEEVITRVRECSVFKCPLWHYRPYQVEDEEAQD